MCQEESFPQKTTASGAKSILRCYTVPLSSEIDIYMLNPLNVYTSLYSLLFLYAMIMPSFHVFFGSSGAAIVNGGVLLGITVYFLTNGLVKDHVGRLSINSYFGMYALLLLSFLALIPISMLSGLIFGNISINNRDFFEFLKPIFNFLVFVFAFYTFNNTQTLEKFEKLLLFIFVVVILIGLNQYLRIFDLISELYTKAHNISTKRVSAPFVNPYDYAFFMSFYVLYFLFKVLFDSPRYLVLLFVAIVFVLLPQSRAVVGGIMLTFIVVLPSLLCVLGVNLLKLTVDKSILYLGAILLFFLLLIGFFLPYLIEGFPYLTGQFVRFFESGEIGKSGQIRLDQFYFALGKASDSIALLLFGNGPAKDEMEYVESIYNYYFYRYGIVGITIYFLSLALSIFLCFKILKNITLHSHFTPLFLAIFVWLVSIPILSVGNNFTEQIRTSFFFYSVLGLITASYYLFNRRGEYL